MIQSVEVIVTLVCLAAFGILVLIGFICLKKRFRLTWESGCDAIFTCCGKYPSEKTEDLRQQKQRAASRHVNGASVLNQQPPSYFGGRKRPEEIESLATAVEGQQQLPQQYSDDVDVEAANDDMPIVQSYNPPSGRLSAGSANRQQQQHFTTTREYYSSSTSRSYSGRPQTSRSDRDRDVLVADDDEATL